MTNEDLNFTMEDCRQRLSKQLMKKLEYSVELLQKAQKIATTYDPTDGYFLAFSGGKDSQCLWHVAKLARVPFVAHFSPTTVDPPDLMRFIHKQYPRTVWEKVEKSMYTRARERANLPSMQIRWCCSDFKEGAGAGKVTLIGIRHAESKRRSKRHEVEVSSRKYSGDLQGLEEFRQQRNKRQPKGVNITNADQEQTVGCIRGKESLLISPIIHWTDADVWEFLNGMQIPHCVLYDQGAKRIGCILCPMANERQRRADAERYPRHRKMWIDAIKDIVITKRQLIAEGKYKGNATLWSMKGNQQEVAEMIFDYWLGKESFAKWYAKKFQQTKLNFEDKNETS